MKKSKSLIFIMLMVFIANGLLSGCSRMLHRMGYAPIRPTPVINPASLQCREANVLITNLAISHPQHYQLPKGVLCDGFV